MPIVVAAPLTFKSLPIVVVPVPAPIAVAVEAPAILTVVALALKRLAVNAVVVTSPPLTAMSPLVATSVLLLVKAVDSAQLTPFHQRVLLGAVPSTIVPVIVVQLKIPEPLVSITWSAVPSAAGNVQVTSVAMAAGA